MVTCLNLSRTRYSSVHCSTKAWLHYIIQPSVMGKGQRDHIAILARNECKKKKKVVKQSGELELKHYKILQRTVQESSALGVKGRRWRAGHQFMSHAVLLLVYFLGQALP